MVILGIETSCDETAASVVKDGREILSHIVASSAEMHVKSGGIIPEQAARQQVKSIIPVIQEALADSLQTTDYSKKKTVDRSRLAVDKIDAIAVTVGPGLIGSLLVGVETAKTLAYVWNKPIVPVNHLVAHIYANWLASNSKFQVPNSKQIQSTKFKIPKLPAVALVVSGGHTDLVLMKDHGKFEYIGGTRDDAAGEAFDKTARLLGLPYPGGPAIAAEAAKLKAQMSNVKTVLPRPMIDKDNFDFSFSGLKTAVLREVSRLPAGKAGAPRVSRVARAMLAWEIQEAITDVLVEKTLRAVKKYHTPTLLLAGGVAANQRLTEKFQEKILDLDLNLDFRVPPPRLCTDNASYTAAYAEYNYHPIPWKKIIANPSLTIMDE